MRMYCKRQAFTEDILSANDVDRCKESLHMLWFDLQCNQGKLIGFKKVNKFFALIIF